MDVQHVNLVNEKNARYQFGDALVNVLVHNLFISETKFVNDKLLFFYAL